MRVFKTALMVLALALGVTDLAKAESMDKDIVEVAASAGSLRRACRCWLITCTSWKWRWIGLYS